MHVANDLHAFADSMHRMQVTRTDATWRFNFPIMWSLTGSFPGIRFNIILIIIHQVPLVFFFFSLQNSARGRTSETPIYPSSMKNMSDVTKRMVPRAILGLFIQNESCPIKRDASYTLHLFIMRHVPSIFPSWLKMGIYQVLDENPCLLPITYLVSTFSSGKNKAII